MLYLQRQQIFRFPSIQMPITMSCYEVYIVSAADITRAATIVLTTLNTTTLRIQCRDLALFVSNSECRGAVY
jgi:hypothetical protein